MRGNTAVLKIQQLTGLLNFFCKAMPSGQPFLRRLYDLQAQALPITLRGKQVKPNPKFKVRLNNEAEKDLNMWKKFLISDDFRQHREIPFIHLLNKQEEGPAMAADAAGAKSLCFGCTFANDGRWCYAQWPITFFREKNPSTTLLELYTIVIAVETWAPLLKGKHIRLCSDNQGMVFHINRKTSKCKDCMGLIRHLTLRCMHFQIYVTARYLPGTLNMWPDMLSRGKIVQFKVTTGRQMRQHPDILPSSLWPITWKLL